MDLFFTILGLVIAFIEFFIGTIEFSRSRRERLEAKKVERQKREKEDADRRIFEGFQSKFKQIDEHVDRLTGFLKEISRQEGFETVQEVEESFLRPYSEVIKGCEELDEYAKLLYKELLLHESEYPLSCGFERMINACREFFIVHDRDVPAYYVASVKLLEYCNKLKCSESKVSMEEFSELKKRANEVFNYLSNVREATILFGYFVTEMRIKFSNVE